MSKRYKEAQSGRVVVHHASPSQVRGSSPGWASSTQPFIPTAVGRKRITKKKVAWGLTQWVFRFRLTTRPEHLLILSGPNVTYSGMDTVGLEPHGMLCH
ncbi:hypothetical protein TNCV_3133371 [Trichonephila clavipes]|nr:hypothetical protein TNCV_3133371 [Trichonephila clavipes]